MSDGQTYHHTIPFVAHKRLTVVSPPIHTVRVRPSVILAEIDRINHKVRPSLAYQPAEDYLNLRSTVSFDDETRSIRAQTAALLKRIHEPLPRATKIFPISVARYQETPIPERIVSDAYIHRLLGPTRNVRQEILTVSHYDEPAKRLMGKGHLACVSFAGGRAFPRRKNLYADDDRVKNDVKYLSLYKKNRDAAEHPTQLEAAVLAGNWYHKLGAYSSPPRSRPISRFYRPTYVPDENLPQEPPLPPAPVKKSSATRSQSQPTVETPSSTVKAERQTSLKEDVANEEFEDIEARMNRRKKKKQEEAAARLSEEQAELEKEKDAARQAELARQEKLAQEAASERQKDLEKKAELARQELAKQKEQEEAERKAEEERLEAERKAEADRLEADRKAEAERLEAERLEAERKAEEERLEAERLEAERLEAERKAEEERLEAERLEAEKKAEEVRLEAERKAEEERKAQAEKEEAEKKAEEERHADVEEEHAKQEEQVAAEPTDAESSAVPEETQSSAVPEETPVPEVTQEDAAAPTQENVAEEAQDIEATPAEGKVCESETVTPDAAEPKPEPVVEEPQTPEILPVSASSTEIEEIHDVGIKEEKEEDEEEEEEEEEE